MSLSIEEVYRIATEAQRRSAEAKTIAEKALTISESNERKIDVTAERLGRMEERMDKLEGKMDTLLDSTAQLKNMLQDNTDISSSARSYSRACGIVMFFAAIVVKIIDFAKFAF